MTIVGNDDLEENDDCWRRHHAAIRKRSNGGIDRRIFYRDAWSGARSGG